MRNKLLTSQSEITRSLCIVRTILMQSSAIYNRGTTNTEMDESIQLCLCKCHTYRLYQWIGQLPTHTNRKHKLNKGSEVFLFNFLVSYRCTFHYFSECNKCHLHIEWVSQSHCSTWKWRLHLPSFDERDQFACHASTTDPQSNDIDHVLLQVWR